VLDWMLPGLDGVTICREVRSRSPVPIIMLTARTQESDQVLGLEWGADDYVTKPFSPLALMARIKAVMRRVRSAGGSPWPDSGIRLQHWRINPETREVFLDGEAIADLTPKEFDLLHFFARHPRRVFSKDELLDGVWGYDFYGDERTVDVHIKRLRKKIARPGHPWIHTVWGVGYKFDEAGEEDAL
jgi:two-component system, OmpR family, response regulator